MPRQYRNRSYSHHRHLGLIMWRDGDSVDRFIAISRREASESYEAVCRTSYKVPNLRWDNVTTSSAF
ncbi:hypothetical protein TsFJ059_000240 [Trichoderma semiorbis]|uniref:Uncharacterized protein n=1 Tax=Trichoderma semiorbis TaxID=1491008 RepID=A0A9P8HP48_9HYPO|nr:hypothetical protein TsFJ059_000240 [Trichoderma semiorbis]